MIKRLTPAAFCRMAFTSTDDGRGALPSGTYKPAISEVCDEVQYIRITGRKTDIFGQLGLMKGSDIVCCFFITVVAQYPRPVPVPTKLMLTDTQLMVLSAAP